MEASDVLQPNVSIRPNVNLQDVRRLIFSLYGIEVSEIVELNGYDDKNYHIIVKNNVNDNECLSRICDGEYVFKVINSLDSKKPELFEAQTALMLHLRDKGITCSKPIPTKDGLYFTKIKLNSDEYIVRLLEYIKGIILFKVPCTPRLLVQSGEFVARIDVALKDFHHAAYVKHKPLWMLESVPKLYLFLFAVPIEQRKKLVNAVLEEFQNRVLSISHTLERGLIHGDFNEQNIIVEKDESDWRIKAVIDFGDCLITCYLYEIAITMAYMILQAKDIHAGGYVLAGYSSIKKLPEEEYHLLKICIAARLCQSLVMGAYTHLQDPENSYVLSTAAEGWTLLEKIWNEPEDDLLQAWKRVAESFNSD